MKDGYGDLEKTLRAMAILPWVHLLLCAVVAFVLPGFQSIVAKVFLLPTLALLVPVGLVAAVMLWSTWRELRPRTRWGLLLTGAFGLALDIGLGGMLMLIAMD